MLESMTITVGSGVGVGLHGKATSQSQTEGKDACPFSLQQVPAALYLIPLAHLALFPQPQRKRQVVLSLMLAWFIWRASGQSAFYSETLYQKCLLIYQKIKIKNKNPK